MRLAVGRRLFGFLCRPLVRGSGLPSEAALPHSLLTLVPPPLLQPPLTASLLLLPLSFPSALTGLLDAKLLIFLLYPSYSADESSGLTLDVPPLP